MPFHLFDHSTSMELSELTHILLNTTQTDAALVVAGVVVNKNTVKTAFVQKTEPGRKPGNQ